MSKDFLESSIECNIGFQLKYGLMYEGIAERGKKVPEIKKNILEIQVKKFLKNGTTKQKYLKNKLIEKLNITNKKNVNINKPILESIIWPLIKKTTSIVTKYKIAIKTPSKNEHAINKSIGLICLKLNKELKDG